MTGSVLDRARGGDERAFGELTGPHLSELRLHCYRILGSLADSEDLLQETLLAAWRGLDGFAGRSSWRSWLYRIATNRCLNAIRDGKRRPPTAPVPPFHPPDPSRLGEQTWLQPYPDAWLEHLPDTADDPAAAHESRAAVELAFIAALQRLPPRQTAAVVLADVLGFAPTEVAELLDTTPTAVKGVLQRARAALEWHRSAPGHHPVDGPGSAAERDLAGRFSAAYATGDLDTVLALLTDDAWLAMPPAPHEYVGRAAVADFLRVSTDWRAGRNFRLAPTRANAQPAFACYLPRTADSGEDPAGVLVLTASGDRISGVTRFLDFDLQRRFERAASAG